MKKSRKQRHKETINRKRESRRRTQKPPPRPSPLKPLLTRLHPRYWLRRSLSWAWKAVVAFSIVLGVIAAVVSFLPRVSVSSSESLNPQTPFAAPFVVSNDGVIKITDVSTQMLVRRVMVAVGKDIVIEDNKLFDSHPIPIPELDSGKKYTVNYPLLIGEGTPIAKADVDITVIFRVPFLPWKQSKTYKFTTEIASDKTLHWFPRADLE
jgi:hypothetical protein